MRITAFSGSLLLVAMLAVCWAVPHPREALEQFLEQNPSVAQDLYPKLLNSAKHVTLDVDRDVVMDLVENYVKDQTPQDTVKKEAAVSRQKRFSWYGSSECKCNNSKIYNPVFGNITSTSGDAVLFDYRNFWGNQEDQQQGQQGQERGQQGGQQGRQQGRQRGRQQGQRQGQQNQQRIQQVPIID